MNQNARWNSENYKCVCLYSCPSYPACKRHAPYYIVNCVLSESTLYFTLSHERHNRVEHEICVLIFSTTIFWKFLILRRLQRDIIINVDRSLCKVNVILFRFWMKLFRDRFSRNPQITNFMKASSENRVAPCAKTDRWVDRLAWRS